ncbi:MAG: integrase arm-type DNA-binding domain-containing protein [Robiginitomaculum sp.]|nr:integrase arm-type DNA-binding domain-containing protein [Robiginitomaculum sp.]
MKPKLNKRTVDAAPAGSLLWDRELPGFGLRTTKAGTKSYVLKYRFHNRQRWFTIGQHGRPSAEGGVWTPQTARDEAIALLGRVKAGHDPAHELAEDRKSETVAEFSVRYIRDHAEAHNKPRSIEETRRQLRLHVLPALGHIRVKDMQRNDVVRFHLGMKATPYQANRCLALVSHMLGKAEQWGLRANGSTVCRGITKFKEAKRERFLSVSELNRLGAALEAAEGQGVTRLGLSIIRLLSLTGARRCPCSYEVGQISL